MKIIAIINQKGGVGKTACAYNLAWSFAERKKPTLLVDLDPSANASKGMNWQYAGEFTISDVLTKKNFNTAKAVYSLNDYLSLIPAKINLAVSQRDLMHMPYRESILARQLAQLGSQYEYVLLDCAPTLSELNINALYAANLILIPVTYENDALDGLNDLFKIINEIKEGHDFKFKIVLNKKDVRKSRTNDYIDSKLKIFESDNHILKTIIRQDEAINQAKIEARTIFKFAPNSHGAQDFLLLTEELLNV